MRCTAITSAIPSMLRTHTVQQQLPSLRFASRAVKLQCGSSQRTPLFVCQSTGAALVQPLTCTHQQQQQRQEECRVQLSAESDMGRVGCEISCSPQCSVVVSRNGRIVFQTIPTTTQQQSTTMASYAVELCEGDVVALRSGAAAMHRPLPARVLSSQHHDAEYMAEELLCCQNTTTTTTEGQEEEDGGCIVGVIGRHEDSLLPPERNY